MSLSDDQLDAIGALLARRSDPGSTHYDGCRGEHIDCAARALLAEVRSLRAERDRYVAAFKAWSNDRNAAADEHLWEAFTPEGDR